MTSHGFHKIDSNVPGLEIKVFKRKLRIYCAVSFVLFFIIVAISVILLLNWFGLVATRRSILFVNPLVNLKCGLIEGKINNDVIEFLGIPYAYAPIGRRRFLHAQQIDEKHCHGLLSEDESMKRLYQAYKYKSTCVQYDRSSHNLIGSEDCLYLNIFTPSTNSDTKLPVVFVISSLFFTYGSGNMTGLIVLPEVVKTTNAIHVTCNYRLGPMNSIINPQNNETNHGLSDLLVALFWIHKYIAFFGGDTSNVILFGVGSGSTMALALYNSNKALNLFSKLWISNPVSLISTGIEEALIQQRNNLVHYKKLEIFQRKLKLEKIFENWTWINIENILESNWFEFPRRGIHLTKTDNTNKNIHFLLIDNNLITEPNLLKKHLFNRYVPIVIGNNINEVDIFPSPNSVKFWEMEYLKEFMKSKMESLVKISNGTSNNSLHVGFSFDNFIKYFEKEPPMTAEDIYTRSVTDIRITCPLNSLLRKMMGVSNTPLIYRYLLEDRHNFIDYFYVKYSNALAAHGWDQIIYFHGYKTLPDYGTYGKKEQLMSEILNKAMYDFARNDEIKDMSASNNGHVKMNLIKNGEIIAKFFQKIDECQFWETQFNGEIEQFMWFV